MTKAAAAPTPACPPPELDPTPAGPRRARAAPPVKLIFTVLAAAGRALPLGATRQLARMVASLLPRASPALRGALEKNARVVLGPGATPAALRRLAADQLRGFAAFTAEIAAAGRRGAGLADLLGPVEGAENLDAAVSRGRGVVAVTLHFGNYELAAAALAGRVPGGVSVLYEKDPAPAWEARRAAWRRLHGVDGIAVGGSPYVGIEALARIRSGGAVLLAGDQPGASAGERLPFCGAATVFSTFAARLALTSGAPLLPAFAVRQPGGLYALCLEPPILPEGRDARSLTAELVAVYERYVRRAPEQWLMVHPFWEEWREHGASVE